MARRWLMAAAAMIVAMPPCGAAPAQPPPKGSVVPPPDEQRAVDEAAYRGMFLYAYDQASWKATDDMLTKIGPARSDVGGWLVDGDPLSPEVVFYDKDAAGPKALYVARFREGELVQGRVLGTGEDRRLSAARRQLIAATNVALEKLKGSGVTRCSHQPFNIVAIPPIDEGEPISVYFLIPRTDMATMPMGGHFMVPVSATDGKPGPVQSFTIDCAEVPLTPVKGTETKVILASHDLTPTPTEIHIYSSLTAQVAVGVTTTTNRRVWLVEGAEVDLIDTISE
ncbi:hypothetical protein FHS96_004418 [Sphingomonas zeicaulis]|uniref:hypothetical protein n=1 Tax=Sphingomonas zeicaulis TaxID=1632740 RepID=UPI003D1C9355